MSKLKKLLILSAFVNALCWLILIPVFQYPDEQSHFAQVQNNAEFGKNQLQGKYNTSYEVNLLEKTLHTNRIDGRDNAYTYHPEFNIPYSNNLNGIDEDQFNNLPIISRTTFVKREATENPPLYYYLGSLFYKVFYNGSIFERIFSIRIFSAFLFIALPIVAFKIARVIFKDEKLLQIALPALLAFMPMLVFSSTGVLPDPLTNLLFSLAIYGSLKVIENGFQVKNISILVIISTLGFYTRQQFFILLPVIITASIIRVLSAKNYKGLALFMLLPFGIGLFYEFINSLVPERPASYLSILDSRILSYLKSTLVHWYRETLPWYWGVYRWLSFTVPHIYYQIINRLILVSLLGIALKLILILKKRQIGKKDWYLIFFICASFVYAGIFVIGDYFFVNQYGYSFGIQGRYFFPLICAHFALSLLGFWTILKLVIKNYARLAVCSLVLLMILFNDLSLVHVSTSYYSTETLSKFILQASQYKPAALKGNIILYILILNITLQSVFGFYLTKKTIKNEFA